MINTPLTKIKSSHMQVRFILAELTFRFTWTEKYMFPFPTLTHILFTLRKKKLQGSLSLFPDQFRGNIFIHNEV